MNEPDKQRRSGTVEVLERGAGNEPIVRERRRKKKEKKKQKRPTHSTSTLLVAKTRRNYWSDSKESWSMIGYHCSHAPF